MIKYEWIDKGNGVGYVTADNEHIDCAEICKRLNRYEECMYHLKFMDTYEDGVYDFKLMLALSINMADIAAYDYATAWNEYVVLSELWDKLYPNEDWDDAVEEFHKKEISAPKRCCDTCQNWQWDWYDDGDEFQACIDYDHNPQNFSEYPGDIYKEWNCPFWEEKD